MTLEYYIKKHRNTFICLIGIIFIATIVVSLVIEGDNFKAIVSILFAYLITFILSFMGFSLIIGFQFVNPFASDKILKLCCNFFLYSTLIMSIFFCVVTVFNINFIITDEHGCFIFTGIYGSLGAFLAALFFKNKYNNKQLNKNI